MGIQHLIDLPGVVGSVSQRLRDPPMSLSLLHQAGEGLDVVGVFGRFDIVIFIEAEDYYKLKNIATEISRAVAEFFA